MKKNTLFTFAKALRTLNYTKILVLSLFFTASLNAQNWNEIIKASASDGAQYDYFGYSVAISGDVAIVGAYSEDANGIDDAGAAYIFERNSSGTWVEEQKIVASDGAQYDNFGYSVAISGDVAIVGAYQEDPNGIGNAGAAYIFERNSSGTWVEEQKIVASDGANGDYFGYSVAISGDVAIVGAYRNNPNGLSVAGAAYIFERNSSGTWVEEQKIVASDGAQYDYFGYSVAISGDVAIVGATYAEGTNGIGDAGAAYIFERNSSGTWVEEQKIVASDGAQYGYFGSSVAISGDVAIVGAYLDNNSAGSAYIFSANNANTTPTDITLSASAIDENVATATTVGSFSTTDADTTDAHTYSLVAGTGDTNNASFTIDGADLKTNAAIDYETNPTLSIRVQTNDGTATFEKEITITVNDLYETNPDFTLDANGVTCNCDNAANLETGDLTINGVQKKFTKRTEAQLRALIAADQNDPEIGLTCTSGITDMSLLFVSKTTFNEDISSWDVSSVTNMDAMFDYAASFNQPIGNWDVSSVTMMQYMFTAATKFNQDISGWDVSSVTYMDYMFWDAEEFDQDIGNWDVSSVNSMDDMFSNTEEFDQDLTSWCVTNITYLPYNFAYLATKFDTNNFPVWGTCPSSNASPTDITLSANTIDENVATATTVGSFSTTDADTTDAHTYSLVVGTGDTNNASFTIDGADLKTNAAIDYETNTTLSIRVQTNDGTATFEKEITINVNDLYETNPNFTLDANGVTCNCDNAANLETGDLTINGVQKKFTKRTEAQLRALIAADQNDPEIGLTCTSGITNMTGLFLDKATFNEDISSWDVSSVTNMGYMFYGALNFDQPIGNWNVSEVKNMLQLFVRAYKFNQPIGNWDVSNVTQMNQLFAGAKKINQPIENWDVSKVRDMGSMFSGTDAFNQPIGNWDVSKVTNMGSMFNGADAFNQPIGNWDVSKVTDMSYMFYVAQDFDQPIGNWDVSNVTDMSRMFYLAQDFNQPIGNWDVSKVTDMSWMFGGALNFDKPIGNWDVSKVTNMGSMFNGADAFNQPIGNWDVSKVTDMSWMFGGALNFDKPIGNWDVSKVTDMSWMFGGAEDFNQNLTGWCVTNITSTPTGFATSATKFDTNNFPDWGSCNTTPTDITLSANAIDENVATGTTVGSFSTTDADSADTHTYSFAAGSGDTNNASFTIDGADLKTNAAIDYETNTSLSIRVQTNDGTATFEKEITITVNDLYETNPNFTLDANGVTCNCDNAANLETGDLTINGVQKKFTKRTEAQLRALIAADQNDPQIGLTCTSGITDMSSLFKDKTTFNEDISSWQQ